MNFTFEISKEFKNISNFSKDNKISLDDIDIFISILLKNAASRLNVDYTIIWKLFTLHNSAFLDFKENFFNNYRYMYIYSDEFKKMCDMVKLPIINIQTERKNTKMILKANSNNYTSEDCIKLFNSLSIEEKLKFIKDFKHTSVELTVSDISILLK